MLQTELEGSRPTVRLREDDRQVTHRLAGWGLRKCLK
jgi:hypothetical protein